MPKIIFFLALLLAGCSMSQIPFSPYKIDIQQGNYVTQDMVAKLKPGMTRSQVRFALGTPLVVDPFRTDRWDYVYVYQKGGVVTEQRRLAVFFKDDKLERVEGDVVPAKNENKAGTTAPKPESGKIEDAADKPKQAQPEEEKGFFGRMLEKIGF